MADKTLTFYLKTSKTKITLPLRPPLWNRSIDLSHIHTHTHTQRERERERLAVCDRDMTTSGASFAWTRGTTSEVTSKKASTRVAFAGALQNPPTSFFSGRRRGRGVNNANNYENNSNKNKNTGGRKQSGAVVITRAHKANETTASTTGTGGGHHLTSKEDLLKGKTEMPIIKGNTGILEDLEDYVSSKTKNRNVYVETYGCQMNANDSEVMMSVLNDNGFTETKDIHDANVILINTCAIRDKAEAKIWQRLAYFRSLGKPKKKAERPVVGVLGCMAERLKMQLLEADQLADIVAGPDAYRDLPNLIDTVQNTGDKSMNVQLSVEETYADVIPVRPDGTHSAFVTIMRGCDNCCTFCIVPYTRGQERSRDLASILYEVRVLSEQGVKEVTLLGQNVNSYYVDTNKSEDFLSSLKEGNIVGNNSIEAILNINNAREELNMKNSAGLAGEDPTKFSGYAAGFESRYDASRKREGKVQFAELLDRVAQIDPEMRIRFTSPHPKDFPDDVLNVIRDRPNVCKCLHMPAQSGSTATLERMRRGYSREAYLDLVNHVKKVIPDCAITTDIISGFCGETEKDHKDTVSLMNIVGYEQAFMFAYSEREGTAAARHLDDDVPEDVKQNRLAEVIEAFRTQAQRKQEEEIGSVHCVLIEGPSKKNEDEWTGKTDSSKWVVFDNTKKYGEYSGLDEDEGDTKNELKAGDYIAVQVTGCSTGTLFGKCLGRTTLMAFQALHGSQRLPPKNTVAAGAR